MKKLILSMFFALFFTFAFSQKKEVILNSDMKVEVVDVLLNADEETAKEFKEASGDYFYWFKSNDFLIIYNEDSELYSIKEVELTEVDLKEIEEEEEEENDDEIKENNLRKQ